MKMRNNNTINDNYEGINSTNVVASVIVENEDEDSEDVYSKVFEEPPDKASVSFQPNLTPSSNFIPKPAMRRKKRKDHRVENIKSGNYLPSTNIKTKQVNFDWLSGAQKGGSGSEETSQVAVLKNMVYKLSVELGKEQSKRRDTGAQLDEVGEAPWLAQVGGLVPLLVAYEEELRELRESNTELTEVVNRNKDRLEELLCDNTEMATQLQDLAKLGPVDYEEFKVIRESAALVLEENSLLKEAQEAVIQKVEHFHEESNDRLNIAAEDIASLKKENTRLSHINKKFEEELEELRKSDLQMKSDRAKSIHIETHTKAVAECQSAFQELKLNYDKETLEKNELIKQIKGDLADTKFNLERVSGVSSEHEAELKISQRVMAKYEELCISLQDKLIMLSKNRADAEEFARKCQEEADNAKMEAESLSRMARQSRAAEKAAERDRGEETEVLERLQDRTRELRLSMAGRIRQLELELRKCEASKTFMKEKLEVELRNTKRELEIQRRISEKYKNHSK